LAQLIDLLLEPLQSSWFFPWCALEDVRQRVPCAIRPAEQEVAEVTVRRYVRERKHELGWSTRTACVPQSYQPGQEGQVDRAVEHGAEQGDESIGGVVPVLVTYGLVQTHHFVAGEVRESARRPGRGDMPADHPFIFAPGSFVGFCVERQVFVDQMYESFFRAQRRTLRVALADRVLAARDLGFVLDAFARASITLRSGNLPSVSRQVRPLIRPSHRSSSHRCWLPEARSR
jgi:hypothetical protein